MPGAQSVDLGSLTRLDGLRIVDIGCGEGRIAGELATRGARVSGYDPFLDTPETEWTPVGAGALRLARAAADAIPEPDATADVVLFIFSLHHVPKAKLEAALREARRLLRPSGRLCVAEPLAEGPAQYIMELYHDETAVRRDAASSLQAYAAPAFASERILYFDEVRQVADFEAFAGQAIAGMRFNGYTEDDVLAPQVRSRFAEMTAAHEGRLDQPVRINLFG